MWVRIIHLTMAPTHGSFLSFLEMDKTAEAHSLQIYDYLSQIHSETNAFLLIVKHNTKRPHRSDVIALSSSSSDRRIEST